MKLSTLYPARKGARGITVEDIWAIPRVGQPVPSPVDPWAAVVVRTSDMEKNDGRSQIWLVPQGEGAPRALTAADRDSAQPAFSPDGKRLAFVRKEGKQSQLHVLPLDGGEACRLTDLPLGLADFRWLPDGTGFVLVAELFAGHPTVEATRAEIERREKSTLDVVVTEERLYRYWDRYIAGGRCAHIFVLESESRRLRDLTPEARGWVDPMEPEGLFDVSPDGSEVAFSSDHSEGDPGAEILRSVVYVVPVAGGAVRPLTENRLRAFRPRYTPDGSGIVYGWTKDPFFYADRMRLGRYDRRSDSHADLLADWDLSPMDWEIDAQGAIAFRAEVDGRTALFDLESGKTPRRLSGDGTVSAFRFGHDESLWYNWQSLQQPAEVFSLPRGGGEPRRHSGFCADALREIALGEVLDLEYEGAEGERVQGYLVLPPGHVAGEKRPLVHVIHGGPHGISGDMFHPRWNVQAFAAPGYVVACVNFQGSTSRGQDFAERIQGAWGDRPYHDVMKATDVLVEAGLADPARMAVTGGSYGGYLAAWIATQTDRFRCVINHAGVFDLLGQFATDVTNGRERSFGGSPWEGIEAIDRHSPSRHTRELKTPMLVIHGDNDYRVPVTQGLQCYNILKAKGVPARLVLFRNENHWVLKPQSSRLWYGEVLAWLDRFLGDGADPEPPAR